ncbi:MAG: exo-alpha-sialidase, partial [Chloroflexi bacterium]|nr:exo-alpha-sialidase [Chloroflexota bacterium]
MAVTARKTSSVLLCVGSRKGLFLLRSDQQRRRWRVSGPFLPGQEVNHAVLDARTGVLYATANDVVFGCRIVLSPDYGTTWKDAKVSPRFPAESGLKLERLWRIEPGRPAEPGVLYCGVAPAALFRSEDGGDTWSEVSGLTAHPSRPQWEPGAGGLCLHSIVLDPSAPRRMWVGISAAGVFRTDDGGDTWRPLNKSVRADFMPEKYPEFGQCVHHLVLAPGGARRLYQQNHCGVYRSDDGAASWREISAGLPSDFGFNIVAHPRRPDVAYVVPLQGGEFRCPPGGRLRVYRTDDAGATWSPLSKGLPQRNSFMGFYREAMCMDALEPAGLYLGTNTGQLYASADEGDTWRRIAATLPPIS